VINRVTCSASVLGSNLYVHVCHPRGVLPVPGLAGCPAVGNSRGTRKLARTPPRKSKKKKNLIVKHIYCRVTTRKHLDELESYTDSLDFQGIKSFTI